MQQLANKPTLCIDFDGVIHRYSMGWQDGRIYDAVCPGFFTWLLEAHVKFKIVVYSSRSKDERMRQEMEAWLFYQAGKWVGTPEATTTGAHLFAVLNAIEFSAVKPAAFLTIDDRCMPFNGDWLDCQYEVPNLLAFKPWNQRP